MTKVKMLESGEVREVTPNVAHGLIDCGKAELYKKKEMDSYEDREMKASTKRKKKKKRSKKKSYKTK